MVVQKGSSKSASKGTAASSKAVLKSGAKVRLKADPKPAAAKGKVTHKATPAQKAGGAVKASHSTQGPGAKASSSSHGSKVAHSSGKTASHKASDSKAAAGHAQKSKINSPMKSSAVKLDSPKNSTQPHKAHHSKKTGSSLRGLGEGGSETVCREVACEGLATSGGYCRLHYIKNWKKIKRKESILREKRLNQYIEELVVKYPDKYIEAIRQDLANDKDFAKVIYDLDLDEGVDDFDAEGGDSVDSLIDNIKRDFDDEGDGF